MKKLDFRAKLAQYLSADAPTYPDDDDLYHFTSEVLLPNKASIPKLYRYSPADYNNIAALETRRLFLSEAVGMNDIYEGLSCTADDSVVDNLEELRDVAYLKSFSEHKNDLLMWGHYGEEYSGMCIEYDLCSIEDSCAYHLFPVVYSDKRHTNGNLKCTMRELFELKHDQKNQNCPDEFDSLKDIMPLFVFKSNAWSYEAEWRLIVPYLQMNCMWTEVATSDEGHAEQYEIDTRYISFPYASAVYLGPRMEKHKKHHIAGICRRLNIKAYEANLSPDSYKLIAKEISVD